MLLTNIEYQGKKYQCDLSKPLDISIPLQSGMHNPNAFGIAYPVFSPFQSGSFIGSVAAGGPVNCENILLNAHGNGTHTECVGHISSKRITINEQLSTFFFKAMLVSVTPGEQGISAEDIVTSLSPEIDAVVVRTLPNTKAKLTANYSGNNPPYLSPECCIKLRELGIRHLLIDLPSVDPEADEGKLAAHHAFWNYPEKPRLDATITEMIYVDSKIEDGLYLLNLMIAPIESDASPSKPILYALHPQLD